ncbi:MAG TPA: L,D-transpeptidase family protein [Pyrinomonadaceae bacterium]|nr:L,D-transpeptidase family protein [Pyrinomonadaceae bacterium]
MKPVLTICLILISTLIGSGQQNARRAHPTSPRVTVGQTKEVERRLAEMGYWTGPVDGRFDSATQSALIAFQKYEGRSITGRLTADEIEAVRNAPRPQPRESGYAHIEVDIDRQVLLIVNEDGSVRLLPTSTGSGKEYLDEGETSVAYTPRGRFLVYNKLDGWEEGRFGSAYYANFISGSVAIHGYPTVPNEPASHGCIRIPIFAAREVSKLMPLGTIVLVYDKVSFVSAKSWAENPQRKKAALYWHRVVD